MNTTTTTANGADLPLPAGAPAAARTVLSLLRRLSQGTLIVHLPDGQVQRFGNGQAPTAAITLRNWNVCAAALKSGDIGFAESYIAGDWTTPNLTDLPKTVDPREVFFWANGEWVSAENDTVNPDNFYSVRPFNPYLDQGSLVNLAVAVPQLMKDYGVDNTWGQFSGQPWEYMPPEVRRELAVKLAVQVGGRPPGNALFWAGVAYGYASTHNSKRYPPVAKHPGVIFLPGKIAKTDKTPPNDPESRALRAAVEAAVGRPLDLTIRTGTGSGWRISLTDAVRHLL